MPGVAHRSKREADGAIFNHRWTQIDTDLMLRFIQNICVYQRFSCPWVHLCLIMPLGASVVTEKTEPKIVGGLRLIRKHAHHGIRLCHGAKSVVLCTHSPVNDEEPLKSPQDLKSLRALNWYPVGDSNPCCLDENQVS